MITYQPKSWWRLFFSLRGTVLTGVAPRALLVALLGLLTAVGDRAGWLPPLDPVVHSILGAVVGLLIVLRTNCSYDRFWDGRKQWGDLIGASRSLVRAAAAYAGPADDLARRVTAHVRLLKEHLRNRRDLSALKAALPAEEYRRVEAAANPPAVSLGLLSGWVARRLAEGRPGASSAGLEGHLTKMAEAQSGCERIRSTPIPFVYAVHIKHLLFAYLATLPFVLASKMGLATPLAVGLIAFGLLGVEEAGLEWEDPFGEDANDLPTDAMCDALERDVTALAELPEPAARKAA